MLRPQPRSARAVRPRNAKGHFLPTTAALAPVEAASGVSLEAAVKAGVLVESSAGAASPKVRRKPKPKKPLRWSAARQRHFLELLAGSANVAWSARQARLAETTVYRRRREDADFRALWEEAVNEGMARLEMLLLHRALHGTSEAIWYGGKKVGDRLIFNDRGALALLNGRRTRGASVPGEDAEPEITTEEMRDEFKARLSDMNRRMGGDG